MSKEKRTSVVSRRLTTLVLFSLDMVVICQRRVACYHIKHKCFLSTAFARKGDQFAWQWTLALSFPRGGVWTWWALPTRQRHMKPCRAWRGRRRRSTFTLSGSTIIFILSQFPHRR